MIHLNNNQTILLAKLYNITVEKRWYLQINDDLCSSDKIRSVYGVHYPVQFSSYCESSFEATVKMARHIAQRIIELKGLEINLEDLDPPIEMAYGYRILKDKLGIGSKYDVGLRAKEAHSFPIELHGDPPVIFFCAEQTMTVLKKLIAYSAQVIISRGNWGGIYNKKDETKAIISS